MTQTKGWRFTWAVGILVVPAIIAAILSINQLNNKQNAPLNLRPNRVPPKSLGNNREVRQYWRTMSVHEKRGLGISTLARALTILHADLAYAQPDGIFVLSGTLLPGRNTPYWPVDEAAAEIEIEKGFIVADGMAEGQTFFSSSTPESDNGSGKRKIKFRSYADSYLATLSSDQRDALVLLEPIRVYLQNAGDLPLTYPATLQALQLKLRTDVMEPGDPTTELIILNDTARECFAISTEEHSNALPIAELHYSASRFSEVVLCGDGGHCLEPQLSAVKWFALHDHD